MFFVRPVILQRLRGPTIFVLSVFTLNLSFWIMPISVGSALHKAAGLLDERVMSSAYLVNTIFRREVNPAIRRSSFAAARFDKSSCLLRARERAARIRARSANVVREIRAQRSSV